METDILNTCVSNISSSPQSSKRKYTYITRLPKIQREPFSRQLLDPTIINTVLQHRCQMNCFHKLTRENVLSIRKEYVPKSGRDKSLWIKDYIRNNIITLDTTRTTRWHIDGIDICKNCWMKATTVTSFKLKNCYKVSHGSFGISRQTNRMSSTLAWLSNYFSDICEKMPTKDEFHLPCFMLWKDILNELNNFLTKEGHKQITLSYFSHVSWKFSNM